MTQILKHFKTTSTEGQGLEDDYTGVVQQTARGSGEGTRATVC